MYALLNQDVDIYLDDDGDLSCVNLPDDLEQPGDGLLTLISRDHTRHYVSRTNACISRLIRTIVQEDPEEESICLGEIDGTVLHHVIEYMDYHEGNIVLPIGPGLFEDPWDQLFINRVANSREAMYQLVCASSYLDIEGLLHLSCANIATHIQKASSLSCHL
jgi:hypothetical protein